MLLLTLNCCTLQYTYSHECLSCNNMISVNIWSIHVHKYINTKVKDAQYVMHRLLNYQVNDILSKLKNTTALLF